MKSVLANAQDFRFTTKSGTVLDLHGSLLGWTDRVGIRLASHEYLKRDGAEVEPMGAMQGRWGFHCCYIGEGVTRERRNLVATIRREPLGQIIHPRLNKIDVACEGAHAAEDPEKAIDYLEFTIDFVENAVDTAFVRIADIGPATRASEIQEQIAEASEAANAIATNRIANTVYAAAIAAVANFTTYADRFSQVALEIAQSPGPDVVLGKLLANALERRDLALVALTKTLVYTLEPDVSLTDARTACYLTYAACVQLYNAVLAQKPPVVPFVVPAAMPLHQVLVLLYGADARAKRDEVRLLNRIPVPYQIPAGTVLRVVAPVVRQ